jgi:hypothetical protein
MMSLVKAVPNGIKDKECERFALQERSPFPYVLEKDPIQEIVSALKSDQSLKTTFRDDTELCLPIWHCGTREAFLMHTRNQETSTFKAYKEACEAYVEQHEVAKQAKAALAILNAAVSKGEKTSRKTSKKASDKALQKAKEGAASADAPDPELHAEYHAD